MGCCLLQHQYAPGQLTNLLRVAVEDSVDGAIRQVAAITFKNLVKADWDTRGGRQGCNRGPGFHRAHGAAACCMLSLRKCPDTAECGRACAWSQCNLEPEFRRAPLMWPSYMQVLQSLDTIKGRTLPDQKYVKMSWNNLDVPLRHNLRLMQ